MNLDSVVAVSGGFDPVHVGHLRLFRYAAERGRVLVLLNSDEWLLRKKGYVFMPWLERAQLLRAMRPVWQVKEVDDVADHVAAGLRAWRPDFFANGGDRPSANAEEHAVCEELGIVELFGVGGTKVQSSTGLVERVR